VPVVNARIEQLLDIDQSHDASFEDTATATRDSGATGHVL